MEALSPEIVARDGNCILQRFPPHEIIQINAQLRINNVT
jgi:hypothetical protein